MTAAGTTFACMDMVGDDAALDNSRLKGQSPLFLVSIHISSAIIYKEQNESEVQLKTGLTDEHVDFGRWS